MLEEFTVSLSLNEPVEVVSIQPVENDGYIISASSQGVDHNIYLVRVDASGNVRWEAPHGHTDRDAAGSVIALEEGRFVVTGTTAFGTNTMVSLIKTDSFGNNNP